MKVVTEFIPVSTRGHTDIIDITQEAASLLSKSGMSNGTVTFFISGSTAGLTTIEYEPGLLQDLPEAFEKLAPEGKRYHHDATWGDGNGYAHLRSALIGTSFSAAIAGGALVLGTWQQIVFLDFDNRPRNRRVHVQIVGE